MTTLCTAIRDLILNILAIAANFMCLPCSMWNCFTAFMGSYCYICSVAKRNLAPQVVAITGANSGIGEGLAYTYAKDKCSLVLLARNMERLEKVADACRKLGSPEVKVVHMDVADTKKLASYLEEKTIQYNIDLFIANAGVARIPNKPLLDQSEEILQINVLGAIAGINAVYKAYKKRGRGGQIACVSSVFGFIGPPRTLSYGASKAAIISYGRDLRALGKEDGITVNTIVPGFIKIPMTASFNARAISLTPESFAEKVKHGLANDVPLISFPLYQFLVFGVLSVLPPAIKQGVSDRIHRWFDRCTS